MGFGKWLARLGAVGGTARWAANGYRFFRQRHPDTFEFTDNDIFRLMIVTRYEKLHDEEAEKFLLSIADTLVGLRALVVVILTVEAGFTENTESNQSMFMYVIDEEIKKKGISPEIIYGHVRKTDA